MFATRLLQDTSNAVDVDPLVRLLAGVFTLSGTEGFEFIVNNSSKYRCRVLYGHPS